MTVEPTSKYGYADPAPIDSIWADDLQDSRQRHRGKRRPEKAVTPKYRKPIWIAAAVVGVAVVIIAGSVWSDLPPQVYSVTGTVTIDGKPGDMVKVEFWPKDMSSNKNFMFRYGIGMSDSSGRFVLKSGAGTDGIAAGDYKVTFSRLAVRGKPVTADKRKLVREGATESIPANYTDMDQTTITAQVSSKQRDFAFEINTK